MARPWRANEPRRPKPTFYKKPKPPKPLNARDQALATKTDPYKDGLLRMFLDDERTCPPGFTLYRNLKEFKAGLAAADLSKLYTISLDWYLGADTASGHDAADHVAEILRTKRQELSKLAIITCHSSNVENAIKMARTLAAALQNEDLEPSDDEPWIAIDVGPPIGKL